MTGLLFPYVSAGEMGFYGLRADAINIRDNERNTGICMADRQKLRKHYEMVETP